MAKCPGAWPLFRPTTLSETAHDFVLAKHRAQAERAGPLGQRPDDGSPQGQNLAKPGFGLRQPHPDRGLAQSRDIQIAVNLSEQGNRQWPREWSSVPFPTMALVNSATGCP